MTLDILREKGIPLGGQCFRWGDLALPPYSKLDDDAFSRVRVILMNGLESQAARFSHAASWFEPDLRGLLAEVRRVETFQQMTVNWLNPPDQTILETTLGYEQTAIEVTAVVAQAEPDAYLAQAYRFGLLEDFDHLYRFAALLDRVEGRDPNTVLQCYTDIRPGRPTTDQHRHPLDDLRTPYDRAAADPRTRIHAAVILGAEHQVRDYYLNVGPTFSDPVARMLYGEIAAVEEQHVTHYGSLGDPRETWLEKWLVREAAEVWAYWSCLASEPNPRLKTIWEQFLEYELGHLHLVMDLVRSREGRDPEALLPASFDQPIRFEAQRDFIRRTLAGEERLTAAGPDFIPRDQEPDDSRSRQYRTRVNGDLAPSEAVARSYRWSPGGELFAEAAGPRDTPAKEQP